MNYRKPLSSEEYILLYLKEFVSEISVCKKIIKYKKQKEREETMEYYIERWENIAKEYYFLRDNHYHTFSYVLDRKTYIINTDFRKNFYRRTGISYQIIGLIHELIQVSIYKIWLERDDILYSKLANKIMIRMNNI